MTLVLNDQFRTIFKRETRSWREPVDESLPFNND